MFQQSILIIDPLSKRYCNLVFKNDNTVQKCMGLPPVGLARGEGIIKKINASMSFCETKIYVKIRTESNYIYTLLNKRE